MPAELYLVFAAVGWSVGGLFIKLVQLGPLAVAGWRSLIAALVLLLFYRRLPRLRNSGERWGVLSYALVVITFVSATKLSTAANAIFLQSTAPLYVGIFGFLWLKEKINWMDVVSLLGVAAGMLLFFAGDLSPATLKGNLIGLASGLLFAFFILCMRREARGAPLEVIIAGNILSAVLTLPFAFFPLPTLKDLAALIFLGTFQLALPYYLYTKAMPHVRALDASLIFLLEPLLNPIWVFLIIGEKPTHLALTGAFLVLFFLILRQIYGWRKNRKVAPLPALD